MKNMLPVKKSISVQSPHTILAVVTRDYIQVLLAWRKVEMVTLVFNPSY